MTYAHRALVSNLVGGILAFTAASQVSAQDIRVTYRAAELQSDEGTRAVFERIKSAARKACASGPYFETRFSCRRDLTGQVVAKIGNRAMLAMQRGKPTELASR